MYTIEEVFSKVKELEKEHGQYATFAAVLENQSEPKNCICNKKTGFECNACLLVTVEDENEVPSNRVNALAMILERQHHRVLQGAIDKIVKGK